MGGFVSTAVETAAIRPQPQDERLVLVLPPVKFDTDKGAAVEIAKGVVVAAGVTGVL